MEEFNNKIENAIDKEEFRKAFIVYFKIKFIEISIDKNCKELKINKIYALSNYDIISVIDDILPAILGDMTTLPKTKNLLK